MKSILFFRNLIRHSHPEEREIIAFQRIRLKYDNQNNLHHFGDSLSDLPKIQRTRQSLHLIDAVKYNIGRVEASKLKVVLYDSANTNNFFVKRGGGLGGRLLAFL